MLLLLQISGGGGGGWSGGDYGRDPPQSVKYLPIFLKLSCQTSRKGMILVTVVFDVNFSDSASPTGPWGIVYYSVYAMHQ